MKLFLTLNLGWTLLWGRSSISKPASKSRSARTLSLSSPSRSALGTCQFCVTSPNETSRLLLGSDDRNALISESVFTLGPSCLFFPCSRFSCVFVAKKGSPQHLDNSVEYGAIDKMRRTSFEPHGRRLMKRVVYNQFTSYAVRNAVTSHYCAGPK